MSNKNSVIQDVSALLEKYSPEKRHEVMDFFKRNSQKEVREFLAFSKKNSQKEVQEFLAFLNKNHLVVNDSLFWSY